MDREKQNRKRDDAENGAVHFLSSVSPQAQRTDAKSRGEGNDSPAYIVCRNSRKHTIPGQLPRDFDIVLYDEII